MVTETLEGNVRKNVQGIGTRISFLNSLLVGQEINPQLDKWTKAKASIAKGTLTPVSRSLQRGSKSLPTTHLIED